MGSVWAYQANLKDSEGLLAAVDGPNLGITNSSQMFLIILSIVQDSCKKCDLDNWRLDTLYYITDPNKSC